MEKLHEARRFCQNLDPTCSRGCNRLIQMLDNRLTDVKTKKKVPKSESWDDVNFVSSEFELDLCSCGLIK